LWLTKTDIAERDAIEQLKRRLVALNPGASWHTVSHGEIAPDTLFGAALFDPAHKTVDVQRWINEAAYQTQGHDHGAHEHAAHEHDHKAHAHGTDISAYCLTVEQPLPWDAFHLWLARVRNAVGENLLRVKGILNLIDEPAPVAIHGVHHVFHPPVQLEAWPDADHRSRIVFITRGIDRAELEESFFEHVVRPVGASAPAPAHSRLTAPQ
jgi:G3E family GTPase